MPTMRSALPSLVADLEASLSRLGDSQLASRLADQEVESRASFGAHFTQIELRPGAPVEPVLPLRPAGSMRCLYLPIRGGSAVVLFDEELRALGLEVTGRADLFDSLARAGVRSSSRLPFG